MSENDIIYADHLGEPYSGITVLHLNNKVSKLNLIDKRFIAQIDSLIRDIKHKNVTKVLIIKSDIEGVFCAGVDLKERLQLNSQQIIDFVDSVRDLTTSIMKMPFPTIAAIDGHAIGGGLEISLCFDIRVIASNAKIGLPETKWAIIPGCKGTQLLPRLIPIHLAKELIFTAQLFQGESVKRLGIANHYVEQNEHGDAAYCKALVMAELIAPNSALAVQSAKLSIDMGIEMNLDHGLMLERLYHSSLIGDSEDMRTRIRSKLCTEKNT